MGNDFDPYLHLMAEMDMDSAFGHDKDTEEPEEALHDSGNGKGHNKSKKHLQEEFDFDPFDRGECLIAKKPLAGTISRVGNGVYCNRVQTGAISYLVHWTPAAISAKCLVHGNQCYFTAPLLEVNEDCVVRWLGEANCFANASDHMRCSPKLAYFQKHGRRR